MGKTLPTSGAKSPRYAEFSDEETLDVLNAGNSHKQVNGQRNAENARNGLVADEDCDACRKKGHKCDRGLPNCGHCVRTNTLCDYSKSPPSPRLSANQGSAANFALSSSGIRSGSFVAPSPDPLPAPRVEGHVYNPETSQPIIDPDVNNIDPTNLYPGQAFTNLTAFKKYVFAIGKAQGFVPYLRRSDRRGAEVRCHSLPNPHKPRSVEFNRAGCQFRVSARTWIADRKAKADLLQDVVWNTPGRWGDGSEPARITTVQPLHICEKATRTGRADLELDEGSEESTSGQTTERIDVTQIGTPLSQSNLPSRGTGDIALLDSQHVAVTNQTSALQATRVGNHRTTIEESDFEMEAPLPLRTRKHKNQRTQEIYLDPEAMGNATTSQVIDYDNPISSSTERRTREFSVSQDRRTMDYSPTPIVQQAQSAGPSQEAAHKAHSKVASANLTGRKTNHSPGEGSRMAPPLTRNNMSTSRSETPRISTPSSFRSQIGRKVRKSIGPNNQSSQKKNPRDTKNTNPRDMITKPTTDLLKEVHLLFEGNEKWLTEVTGPALVEEAAKQWNCSISLRLAYSILFHLREDKGLVTERDRIDLKKMIANCTTDTRPPTEIDDRSIADSQADEEEEDGEGRGNYNDARKVEESVRKANKYYKKAVADVSGAVDTLLTSTPTTESPPMHEEEDDNDDDDVNMYDDSASEDEDNSADQIFTPEASLPLSDSAEQQASADHAATQELIGYQTSLHRRYFRAILTPALIFKYNRLHPDGPRPPQPPSPAIQAFLATEFDSERERLEAENEILEHAVEEAEDIGKKDEAVVRMVVRRMAERYGREEMLRIRDIGLGLRTE